MARDVENLDLKRLLIRIYLATTADRGYILYDHPKFKGWDGMPVRELPLRDHEQMKAMAQWLEQTEEALRQLPDSSLTDLEKALRDKSYFKTRAGKHFDKPAVGESGALWYSGTYKFDVDKRPFPDDEALLNAYNASMFTEFRDVNVGTLKAFEFDYDDEFNPQSLKDKAMSDELVIEIMKLGTLYNTRIQSLPEKNKRCTIFSPSERDATWDAFTAGQISNADGSETMELVCKGV